MIARLKTLWAGIRFAVLGERDHLIEQHLREVRRLEDRWRSQRDSYEFLKGLLHTQAAQVAPMRRQLQEAEQLAVGLRRANDQLVIENERLRAEVADRIVARAAEVEGLLSALAQVRDLFPVPPEGPRRIAWEEAVSFPTSVPAFARGEVEHLREQLEDVDALLTERGEKEE